MFVTLDSSNHKHQASKDQGDDSELIDTVESYKDTSQCNVESQIEEVEHPMWLYEFYIHHYHYQSFNDLLKKKAFTNPNGNRKRVGTDFLGRVITKEEADDVNQEEKDVDYLPTLIIPRFLDLLDC